MERADKDGPRDPCPRATGAGPDHAKAGAPRPCPAALDVDLAGGSSPSRAGEPARRPSRIPPRIADRPRIEEWDDDELLTLPEAAALFWPAGPITVNTLRTAGHDGALAITKVAGKFFTTPMAIRRMGVDEDGTRPAPEQADDASVEVQFQRKLEEARRVGRERKRRQRAAKRPVVPDASVGARR